MPLALYLWIFIMLLVPNSASKLNMPEVNVTVLFSCFESVQAEGFNSDQVQWLILCFQQTYPIADWMANGFFTTEYIKDINPHWLRFGPRPQWEHHFLGGIYAIIMGCGIVGNFLVIYLFLSCKPLRTPAHILVFNLACSDLLMMLKMPIFIYNSIHLGPALGDKVCRLYGFIGGLSGTCSICNITAISLDRFYVVRYPLKNRFSSMRAKICVLFTWIYSGCFAIIPLLDVGYGKYTPEGFLTSCSFDYLTNHTDTKNYIWLFFIGAFVLPFSLIVYFYGNILVVVLRKPQTIGKQRKPGTDSQRHMKIENKCTQELRVTMLVFAVIILWFLAWTPYTVVALLGICGCHSVITPLMSMIPALFCKTASCCDPFMYALTHPKFKEARLKLFGMGSRSKRNATISSRAFRTSYIEQDERKSYNLAPQRSFDEGVKGKSWWYRPSFKDRSSSLKFLSRKFNRRKSSLGFGKQQREAEDCVEEFSLGNIQVQDEFI